MSSQRASLALVLGLVLLVPGCITFDGEQPIEVRMLVTQDVGTHVLVDENITTREGATAMDALREVAEVSTRHGGGFVASIEGIESRYPEQKVDWFYHVDSRLAGLGAAQYALEDGDVVLFDHRSWQRTMHLPHVLTGLDGWPIDSEEPTFEEEAFRERQAEDPSSLYARIEGSQLTLLDADGEASQQIQAPWLLAHATAGPGEEPSILLVASGPQAHGLVDELSSTPPTGVGVAITPNATMEVPT